MTGDDEDGLNACLVVDQGRGDCCARIAIAIIILVKSPGCLSSQILT